ncbi:hypothetical protein ACFWIN_26670 [Streptomyces sp. NPDC127049]|uniref:hypothetical protein n=1 Tax=Streptomyces sp. NPDC127049 TaxID=3347118 RepID=UPI003660252B
MGFTSVWAVTAHPDPAIATFAAQLLPALREDSERPGARERWEAWRRTPLPDHRTWYTAATPPGIPRADPAAIEAFHELTSPGPAVDEVCGGLRDPGFSVLDDVWGDDLDEEDAFLSVHSKEYAVASLFHALGPARAGLLPGWCGNFLLTAAETAATLPAVERAFSFTAAERAEAGTQDWLAYGEREESVLDGPPRVWRAAVGKGYGLCGVAVHLA